MAIDRKGELTWMKAGLYGMIYSRFGFPTRVVSAFPFDASSQRHGSTNPFPFFFDFPRCTR